MGEEVFAGFWLAAARAEFGFTKVLAVLAFKAVLDPPNIVEVRRDKEEVVSVEANVVHVAPSLRT